MPAQWWGGLPISKRFVKSYTSGFVDRESHVLRLVPGGGNAGELRALPTDVGKTPARCGGGRGHCSRHTSRNEERMHDSALD